MHETGIHMAEYKLSVDTDLLGDNNKSRSLRHLVGHPSIVTGHTHTEVPHGEGGGIVFTACNTTVEGLGACGVHNTKFTRNKASDRGGAVSISKEGGESVHQTPQNSLLRG